MTEQPEQPPFDYDQCPHGNGLSCRECQLEAEAEDATWD